MADCDNKGELLSTLSEIVNIDRELARYYLQKTRWNVEAAINEYYADIGDVTGSSPQKDKPPSYAESEGTTSHEKQNKSEGCENTPQNVSTLKLLCWNLDGLDVNNLEERTTGIVQTVLLKKPDVVFFQEVVPYSLKVLRHSCTGYMVLVGDYTVPYFNAILLRNSSVQTKESATQFIPFPTSIMGRHYLIHPIKFADAKIILMTSHLESLVNHAAERKKQLKEVLDYIKRQNASFNVLFGGDTNLRDSEVDAIGGLPNGIQDAWTSCGSPPAEKYSWDMSVNDNEKTSGEKKPRLRFDRIFLRSATQAKTLQPHSFTLVGKERLESCGRFPSDHWAIWFEMRVE